MTPPSADQRVRVAVFGAASPAGVHVRVALVARGLPGSEVDLYASEPGEALLGEYDGEARLLQDPVVEEVARAGVVFICERAAAAEAIVARREEATRVIDLTGLARTAPLAHVPLAPPAVDRRVVRVPHALSIVLAELLHPLMSVAKAAHATAFVLRPAADFGEAGLDELREQTIRLLRFDRPPTEVFGRQLAFNLIPQSLLAHQSDDLESRVAEEATALLGGGLGVDLMLVTVPVFYGHGLCVRLDGASCDPVDLSAAIAGTPGLEAPSERTLGTPIDTPEVRRTSVSGIRRDASGGVWLWAVAAEAPAAAAAQAVLIAEALGRWTS